MNSLLQPPAQARSAPTTGTLYLYDAIGSDGLGGIGEQQVVDALAKLRADGHQQLEVRVASPGGSVFAGLAIYRAISDWKGKKTCVVDSLAASAASFIMLACDRVLIAPQAMVMIHEAHGVAVGTASDLEATAALLKRANDTIVGIYSSRTRMDPETARTYMAAETWFTGQEAVDAGLATSVLDEERPPISAVSDSAATVLATFKRAPTHLQALARHDAFVKHELRVLRDRLSKTNSGRGIPAQPGWR